MTVPTMVAEVQSSARRRLFDAFVSPSPMFQPVPFWSWNERMQPDEVRRQVSLIARGGWGGAFVHSRGGRVTPYLGDAWFDAVDAAVSACREQGIHAWLYDEDGWPSGFSGGSVPKADESHRLVVLMARRVGEATPARAEPFGEPAHGVQLYTWRAQLDDPRFNGACYASLLKREAVERFIEDAYESYHRRYGRDYGDLVPAVFTDEPSVIYRLRVPEGAVPFTPDLLDQFERLHGYDPRPSLYLLFVDAPQACRFRLHYYRTVSDLFEQHYIRALGRWCDAHGVALTGHLMAEHHLYDQHAWSVNVMPLYRHFGIPGVDHLSRQVEEKISAKQCASVANQFGKRRVLSELYGMAGQGITFEDRHWIAVQQIALGVNLLNPHLALYTMAGSRKRDFPPNLYYQQPWWPRNRVVDEPLARLCAAMSHGRYVAETLVIHPQDSVSGLWQADAAPANGDELVARSYTPTTASTVERVGDLDARFKSVIDALLDAQRTFDLGDESILAAHATVEHRDGRPRLRVGEMTYPSVVLPHCITLRPTTFALLREFADAGGLVVSCGEPPRLVDGRPDAALGAWVDELPAATADGLPQALAPTGAPLVRFESETPGPARLLFVHTRELNDMRRLVFVANLDRFETRAGRLRMLGGWTRVEHMDHWTGEAVVLAATADDDETVVDVSLAPGQAQLLYLSDEPGLPVPSARPSAVRDEVVLDPATWRVERLDDNALTLDMAHWREGDGPWSRCAVPVIAVQRRLETIGRPCDVSVRFSFHVAPEVVGRRVRLVVEYPERYGVLVNGSAAAYAGLEPWIDMRWSPIDISPLLRPGENTIELRQPRWRPRPIDDDAALEDFVELEAVYLVGDFSVRAEENAQRPVCPAWAAFGLPPIRVRCFDGDSFQLAAPSPLKAGDTTTQGLPFYAGRLRMVAPLPPVNPGGDDRWLLRLDSHDAAVVEVAAGGCVVGHFAASPYEINVTRPIRDGVRELHLTAYGTLRNLLGPHHDSRGELPAVTPHSFLPAVMAGGNVSATVAAWGDGTQAFTDWASHYAMVAFGEIQGLRLVRTA